jgi:hypothetical protein
VNGVGQSFSLPFKSPNWLSTCLVMGLLGIIPIVGQINLFGWMLTTLDNYRQGRTDLPPAGFGYVSRGMNAFVVFLVYGLGIAAVFVILFVLAIVVVAGASTGGQGASNGAAAALTLLYLVMYAGLFVVIAVFYLFYPAIIVATERYGIGGGLNPRNVYAIASHRWGNTLLAALLVYAALLIGGLGIYACCVGYFVSLPIGYAIIAGVLRYYEATFEAAPPPPVPPAAATA